MSMSARLFRNLDEIAADMNDDSVIMGPVRGNCSGINGAGCRNRTCTAGVQPVPDAMVGNDREMAD
jgi:hypothetical protein